MKKTRKKTVYNVTKFTQIDSFYQTILTLILEGKACTIVYKGFSNDMSLPEDQVLYLHFGTKWYKETKYGPNELIIVTKDTSDRWLKILNKDD